MLAHGLRLTHTHHAHALHAPFWWLKCAVGTEKSDHPAVTAYHKLLVWDMMSRPWLTRAAEAALNPLIGKSVALYFRKPGPMRRCLTSPGVPGVFTPQQCLQTAESIAATQEPSGAIPWSVGGHTDPWDHIENAMALTAAGLHRTGACGIRMVAQRHSGRTGPGRSSSATVSIEDANSDSNFCAYIATGVWHHVLVTGDRRFAEAMWPVVAKAIDFVLELQSGTGEIAWAKGSSGIADEALLTGCASIYHSLRCALALADFVDAPAAGMGGRGRAGWATRSPHHPEAFVIKDRWSMEWYYPVLGGALRGPAARARIDERWDDFVVPGLGIRCVDDRPWVTGAETCELVLALDAIGDRARAHEQFAAMHHLREEDGSYWTGLVYSDGKRWPVERTTWTGGSRSSSPPTRCHRPHLAAASSVPSICRAASRAITIASARRASVNARPACPADPTPAPAPASSRGREPRGNRRSPKPVDRCGTVPGRHRPDWGTRRG